MEIQNFTFEDNPGFDLRLFTSRGFHSLVSSSLQVHFQEGASFGQRLEKAIESIARLGYQEIVVVGRDCPELGPSDLIRAFELLRQHRLVLGPDHRGGCYLIGFHANDRKRLHGIRWQRNTDFRQIRDRFSQGSGFELPVKTDLDTLEDVHLLAASDSQFRILARDLLDSSFLQCLFRGQSFSTARPRGRIHWQLPPPMDSSPFNIT